MQLKFNRSTYDKKGLFGSKTRYKLEAQVDVNDAERKLLAQGWNLQYLALEQPIQRLSASQDFSADLADRRAMQHAALGDYSTDQLLKGLTLDSDDAAVIQDAEQGLITACKWVQNHCKVDESFASGKEQIIEI